VIGGSTTNVDAVFWEERSGKDVLCTRLAFKLMHTLFVVDPVQKMTSIFKTDCFNEFCGLKALKTLKEVHTHCKILILSAGKIDSRSLVP